MKHYEKEFKEKIVKEHIEEGRTLKSLSEEYKISSASISIWIKRFREECQENNQLKENYDYMLENRNLKHELEEMKKENQFLKKAAAFFAKETDS